MARRSFCVLVPVFLATGCVPTVDPLVDPDRAEPDKALVGTWADAEQPKKAAFTISPAPPVKGNPKGLMVIEATSADWPSAWFVASTHGKHTYASLFVKSLRGGASGQQVSPEFADFSEAGGYGEWTKLETRMCVTAHYTVRGDRLMVNRGDPIAYDKFSAENRLGRRDGDAVPMAGGAWLAGYLSGAGPGKIFPARSDVPGTVRHAVRLKPKN